MKYGEVIKSEEIDSLIDRGLVKFGMKCQFSDDFSYKHGTTTTGTLIDVFHDDCPRPFLCEFKNHERRRFYQARIPIPDLRDGDPIWVRKFNSHKHEWMRVVLKSYSDGAVEFYENTGNKWTSKNQGVFFGKWRLPTKKELKEAGMENWYDGRIELEDE